MLPRRQNWRANNLRRGVCALSMKLSTIADMGDIKLGNGAETRADHPLQMSGRGVIYSLSFDLGPGWNPVKVANRLLRKNMATVAGSPSRDGLSVGRQVTEADRFARKAQDTSDFFQLLGSHDAKISQLWQASPMQTLSIFWKFRSTLLRSISKRILFGQNPRNQQFEIEDIDPVVGLQIAPVFGRLKEVVDQLRIQFMHQLAMGAFRLRVEQRVFFPRYYLKVEPYIRLEMKHAYFTDSDFTDEPLEVSLMLHRSGVCILTFASPITEHLSVRSMHDLIYSEGRQLDEARICFPILHPRRRRFISYEGNNYVRSGEESDVSIGFQSPQRTMKVSRCRTSCRCIVSRCRRWLGGSARRNGVYIRRCSRECQSVAAME